MTEEEFKVFLLSKIEMSEELDALLFFFSTEQILKRYEIKGFPIDPARVGEIASEDRKLFVAKLRMKQGQEMTGDDLQELL